MIRKLVALLLAVFVALPAVVQADATDAVVRIPSHGASGSVIYTEPGRSLILSCAHMLQGADRNKAMALDVPVPQAGQPRSARPKVLQVDYKADLSLIELPAGPLPYVAPVAPGGYRPGRRRSAGG